MFFFLAAQFYTGFLGLKWREARTIGERIRELRQATPQPATPDAPAPAPNPEIQQLEQVSNGLLPLLAAWYLRAAVVAANSCWGH